MSGYEVKIIDSSKELTLFEKIALKDTSDCISLDIACENEPIIIQPKDYVLLQVHNEKADNKEYEVFIVTDMDNNKYITSSDSFYQSFMDIYNEIEDNSYDGVWNIKIYKKESKNFKGKMFITCSIVM